MAVDSILIAAAFLLGASLFAAASGRGVYLRFAAMLSAALAAAVLLRPAIPALGGAVALAALPLVWTALGLSAAARFLRPLPPLAATLLLVAAFACGLLALFGASLLFALLPLLLGGLAAAVAALHRAAFVALFSGLLLMAAASAFLARGVAMPGLLLLAAALAGLSLQRRVSTIRAVSSALVP